MDTENLVRMLAGSPPEVPAAPVMLPTGSVSLDILLGGGWRKGAVSELHGHPDCGTTTVALRTAAAVQQAYPGENAVIYDNSPGTGSRLPGYAATLGADLDRLIIARPSGSLPGEAAITIIDGFSGSRLPPRENLGGTVLVIPRNPGLIRSDISLRLQRKHGAPWAWAILERPPVSGTSSRMPSAPICLSANAWFQEILQTALQYGLVEVHGKRWYYCGLRKIAGGWHDAVLALQDSKDLFEKIINGIAEKTGCDGSNWLTSPAMCG